jgi:uncharacterized protein YdcH (DUF465 family)
MSEHHSIASEFPEFQQKIHYLKMSDAHFKKLCDSFEEVDKSVARAESRIELLSEDEESALRKERLLIKDQILEILKR